MKIDALTDAIGEWLRGTGPESDIVMSSRVRLARNIAHFPFVSRVSEQERFDTETLLRERIAASPIATARGRCSVGWCRCRRR